MSNLGYCQCRAKRRRWKEYCLRNLAMHLIDQGIPVIVYDADIQQTLVRHRQRELAEHPDAQPPYQLMPFSAASMSLGSVVRRFRRLVPSPNARKERYCNCMHQAARKVKCYSTLIHYGSYKRAIRMHFQKGCNSATEQCDTTPQFIVILIHYLYLCQKIVKRNVR